MRLFVCNTLKRIFTKYIFNTVKFQATVTILLEPAHQETLELLLSSFERGCAASKSSQTKGILEILQHKHEGLIGKLIT